MRSEKRKHFVISTNTKTADFELHHTQVCKAKSVSFMSSQLWV
jgi:hypothetical protein